MNSSQKIKHLYWRGGFGLSPKEWQTRQSWTINEAIDSLFAEALKVDRVAEPEFPVPGTMQEMSKMDRQQFRKDQRKLAVQVNLDWVTRMASSDSSALLEKMTLFWHGHFACTTNSGLLAVRQLNVLRNNALGNFRSMLKAIARDPSMIRFLNNQQNRKNAPNENFARELMELFTLGRGNYTEQDIKASARAFTGWSSNLKGTFIFRRMQHDYGPKTFMGQTGNFDGDDIIDIILERPEVATFICRKIYAFFVNTKDNPSHINELAEIFRSTDYDIAAVMRHLFSADWFYAPDNIGNRIKPPVELIAGLARQLHATNLPTMGVIGIQRLLGQQLFRPPNVAGWPGGRNWIDNSTLVTRLNLAGALVLASDFDLRLPQDLEGQNRKRLKRLKANLDLAPIRSLYAGQQGQQVRATLADYLLVPPAPQKTTSTQDPDLIALQLLSTPEYQLC